MVSGWRSNNLNLTTVKGQCFTVKRQKKKKSSAIFAVKTYHGPSNPTIKSCLSRTVYISKKILELVNPFPRFQIKTNFYGHLHQLRYFSITKRRQNEYCNQLLSKYTSSRLKNSNRFSMDNLFTL